MRVPLSFAELRTLLQKNLAKFTRDAKLACDSTIGVYKAGDDIFRYKAAASTCV